MLDQLQKLSATSYVDATRLALIYVGLGETDQAMSWLQKAYDQRDVGLVVVKADPRFVPLRNDPRFQELLRNMRFP